MNRPSTGLASLEGGYNKNGEGGLAIGTVWNLTLLTKFDKATLESLTEGEYKLTALVYSG